MPRQRKAQNGSVRKPAGTGRVANTTTSSLPQVYRFGNNVSNKCCKDVPIHISGIKPIHVTQQQP